MSDYPTHAAVYTCARRLLAGGILHAGGVTAGGGSVIDWRTVKSGETLEAGLDAYDTALLFVALVGDEPAVEGARRELEGPAEPRDPVVGVGWSALGIRRSVGG